MVNRKVGGVPRVVNGSIGTTSQRWPKRYRHTLRDAHGASGRARCVVLRGVWRGVWCVVVRGGFWPAGRRCPVVGLTGWTGVAIWDGVGWGGVGRVGMAARETRWDRPAAPVAAAGQGEPFRRTMTHHARPVPHGPVPHVARPVSRDPCHDLRAPGANPPHPPYGATSGGSAAVSAPPRGTVARSGWPVRRGRRRPRTGRRAACCPRRPGAGRPPSGCPRRPAPA